RDLWVMIPPTCPQNHRPPMQPDLSQDLPPSRGLKSPGHPPLLPQKSSSLSSTIPPDKSVSIGQIRQSGHRPLGSKKGLTLAREALILQYARQGSNLRPPGSKPGALSG